MTKTVTAWIFLVLGLVLFAFNLLIVKPFLISIIAGAMMALILRPMSIVLRSRMSPYLAALVATLVMGALVLVPLILLSIVALRDANTLVAMLTNGDTNLQIKANWQEFVVRIAAFLPFAEVADIEEIAINVGQFLLNWSSTTALRIAADVPSLLLQLTLGCLSCYFFLIDGHVFRRFFKRLVPLPPEIQGEIGSAFHDATRATLLASLAAAVVQAIIVAITFAVLGIPAIALATGGTFIFAWIPVLGSVPVFFAAGIWLASLGLWGKFTAIVVMAGITGLADNVIRPLVLRGGNDMHPLISLVAILGGIEFFGLLGVMLGPVIVAVFLSCAKVWPTVAKAAGWMKASEN